MIDLHLHLDGSLSPQDIINLAAMQEIPLPAYNISTLLPYLSCPPQCKSLDEYLSCFNLPLSVLQTKEAIKEAFYSLCTNLQESNMLYAEIRFAPQLHTKKGLTQREIIKAALQGINRSSFHANIILCCMRGAPENINIETVLASKNFLGKGVVAIDLAGAENHYPTKDYESIFSVANELSVPIIMHAGESDGPSSIRSALEMRAQRIGHGVSAAKDTELLYYLQKNQTPIEVCITSNLQTGAVSDIKDHPIKKFLEMNLCVTLNTDNMTVSNTNIYREFAIAKKYFAIDDYTEKILLSNAVQSSFLSDNEKNNLMMKIFK